MPGEARRAGVSSRGSERLLPFTPFSNLVGVEASALAWPAGRPCAPAAVKVDLATAQQAAYFATGGEATANRELRPTCRASGFRRLRQSTRTAAASEAEPAPILTEVGDPMTGAGGSGSGTEPGPVSGRAEL
ncbi:hypothetical protein NL676_019390 [Syzygium grande]|nr:hypothetical protein NL676_019390 [Syzygium grande]